MNNQNIETVLHAAIFNYLEAATKVAFDADVNIKADFNEIKDKHKDLDLKIHISYRPKL